MNILKKITSAEKKADEFGFKWSDPEQILEQINSECKEIQEVLVKDDSRANLQDEIGDLIHAAFSLCLFCGFSLEETLEKNLSKFEKRYAEVVRLANKAGYNSLAGEPLEKLMEFWNEAKKKS